MSMVRRCGDEMAEHGTRTMYVHYGCRCDACCKAEHAQYLKRPEAKLRNRVFSKWDDTVCKRSKTDAQRAADSRRRAAIASRPKAHGKLIRWYEIADAFDMKCAICGQEVDPDDTWVNETGRKCFGRKYPTVDHILPIKRGGSDTFDNVQLACKQCNSRKGSKAVSA